MKHNTQLTFKVNSENFQIKFKPNFFFKMPDFTKYPNTKVIWNTSPATEFGYGQVSGSTK